MRILFTFTAVASILTLGACDEANSDLERAIIGGAIGCAAGEVLVDGRCVEGAAVGAAIGVLSD